MRSIRILLAATVASGLMLVAVGCGADEARESAGGPATTIVHTMGKTTIEGVPKRIVTLGNQWLDAVQALGVTPVAYLDNVAVVAGGSAPWEPASLRGAKSLSAQGDIVEEVAAQNPDLILAPGFFVDKATYDKLSRLAPTVAALTHAQIDPWREQVAVVGKVLHKQHEADKVVADVDARINDVAARHPGLRGKTFVTAWLSNPTQLMVLADPKDGASALFTQLGMSIPQQLVSEATTGGRLSLSPERVGDLNSDLLTVMAGPGLDGTFKKLPGYQSLPSVRRDSVAFIDLATGSGLNQPTPLNVPYLLGKLEPAFANAAI